VGQIGHSFPFSRYLIINKAFHRDIPLGPNRWSRSFAATPAAPLLGAADETGMIADRDSRER